jgi:hypothetical protein
MFLIYVLLQKTRSRTVRNYSFHKVLVKKLIRYIIFSKKGYESIENTVKSSHLKSGGICNYI